ncbi:bifunctional diguanylate cyclase/phosphodiesterase [Psychromonas sp. RZ22]|uniref:bifunctional diguanylate cyclase/phosphodiesterase n=1 Tax=Psychromonas algarum TaxID=2555643 RepID=UPI0010675344|nr:EAL domain-containing protein [Psychromonas sp. RZ22]TEW56845.1 bifunctional diguanylate cyclase/phosphodiesterase [Psychromonas sp. RZ22]
MNKKIWLLFYTIVVLGSVLLFTAVYAKYTDLMEEVETEQVYVTKSLHNYLHSLFSQYDIIHNLVADQYLQPNFSPSLLNSVVNQNPLLYNIAIFSVDGQLIEKSNQKTDYYTVNKWFRKALDSQSIVLGEVMFDQRSNKWLIPLYKSIQNSAGSVVGVFISTLDIQILNQQWKEDIHSNNIQATLGDDLVPIFRANLPVDSYAQYYSPLTGPKTAESIDLKTYLEGLDSPTEIYTHQAKINNAEFIFTVTYDSRYQFWVSTDIPYTLIKERVIYHSFFYSAFYLLLIIIVWAFIKWIIRIEESQIIALTYEAEHDALTQLPNGNALTAYGNKAEKNNRAFALLYLNLNKFKNINDTFGHSYGDKILIQVAQRIKDTIKKYDGLAIRYSGDEFVLLVNSSDKELLQHCIEDIQKNVNQPYLVEQNVFKITSSIGIACYPEDAKDIESLLSYADNSMTIAKQTNNQYLFFSKSAHRQLIQRVDIEQALHNAIDKEEISIVYQPQVNADNTLIGVEALVRWNNQKMGFIGPDLFIPIAEEVGLMPKLGSYIMHRAMQEIAQLQREIEQTFTLSINVSVRQFVQINFMEKVLNSLNELTKIDQRLAITIEITESLFIENLDSLLPLFQQLKQHHITLSLDDFGTGYSSLSLLRHIPIDELKIDKSFVDHICTDATDKAMVESIISMGKKLGLTVLAEGVEDRKQADILLTAGCDLFQGYFFSKPLSIADLKAYCLQ